MQAPDHAARSTDGGHHQVQDLRSRAANGTPSARRDRGVLPVWCHRGPRREGHARTNSGPDARGTDPVHPRSEFVGLENVPAESEHKGLAFTLHCTRLGFIRPHPPIFYRGIEVGAVQDTRLSPDATGVDLQLFISQRYAPLVRDGSKFWKISGVEISGGLFRGLEFKLESLSTLVTGGIEFATPEYADGASARKETGFELCDEPQKEWMTWALRLPIKKEQ
jgi:hypothetical protein